MTPIEIVLIFLLLQIKHLVFDFLFQPPWQYKNKGTFGHWGGIVHSLQHGVPTFLILLMFTVPWVSVLMALLEFSIHYLVDWSKMNLNAKMGWGPTTSENFWRLLGVDQFFHQLTYVGIVFLLLL